MPELQILGKTPFSIKKLWIWQRCLLITENTDSSIMTERLSTPIACDLMDNKLFEISISFIVLNENWPTSGKVFLEKYCWVVLIFVFCVKVHVPQFLLKYFFGHDNFRFWMISILFSINRIFCLVPKFFVLIIMLCISHFLESPQYSFSWFHHFSYRPGNPRSFSLL